MPDALVTDHRRTGSKPGLHVLVVGVSDYPHLPEPGGIVPIEFEGRKTFGLAKLRSAATAACKFVEFLHNQPSGVALVLPLASCRVLLSPHADERASVDEILRRLGSEGVPAATTEQFQETCRAWREDAEADGPDATTLFYFAGHGVQVERGQNATMLLADFPPPGAGAPMTRALHLSNLEGFMAGSSATQSRTPRHQYYFIDACRTEPEELVATTKKMAWSPGHQLLGEVDNRNPVGERHRVARFFAAPARERNWGRAGLGTYFGHALRRAMAWAGTPKHECILGLTGPLVTPESLGKALRHEYAELIEQEILHGYVAAADVLDAAGEPHLPDPPLVDSTTMLPLLRLALPQDCRVRFGIEPPGRGPSQAYVEFLATMSGAAGEHVVFSGPLGSCPRFWVSPRPPFVVRIWRRQEDHAQGRAHAAEYSDYLARPADRVIISCAWEQLAHAMS